MHFYCIYLLFSKKFFWNRMMQTSLPAKNLLRWITYTKIVQFGWNLVCKLVTAPAHHYRPCPPIPSLTPILFRFFFVLFLLHDSLTLNLDLNWQDCRYHSIFACPILRQQTTRSNPPVRLICGHVISRDALNKLSNGNKWVLRASMKLHASCVTHTHLHYLHWLMDLVAICLF